MPGRDLFAESGRDLLKEEPSSVEEVFQEIPGASVLSEFAAAANRSLADVVDFFGPDAINSVLSLAGSDTRVPTARETLGKIGVGDGGYMEPGLARDVVTAAGETAPIAVAAGGAVRRAGQMMGDTIAGDVIRQASQGTARGDALAGVLSGAGAEVGEEVGGDVGRAVGAVAAPVAGSMARIPESGLRALKGAAPTIESLKGRAKEIYQQIDELGVTIDSQRLTGLADDIVQTMRKSGFNARIHPKVSAAIDEIVGQTDKPLSISEIDILRRVAGAAARSIEPDESRLGSMMVEKIDDFLDDIPPGAFNNPREAEVGPLIKQARDLWGRARKSEMIETAFEKAANQASGLENGLRVQFRALLNNKKAMKGFTEQEKEALRTVVRGSGPANIAKAIGKFGFAEGQATSMLLSSLGVAGGAAVGGPVGAVAVPVIGQTFKKAAQALTRRNADLANLLVRSGRNGVAVANAYKKVTPRAERNTEELAGLLLQRNADLDSAMRSSDKLISDAALTAAILKNAGTGSEPRSEEPTQ